MMTMMDQAARAVHDHWMKNFDHAGLELDSTPYDDLDDKSKAYALGQVRAVLESVRVPSDGVAKAGEEKYWAPHDPAGTNEDMKAAYTAMIDHMLNGATHD